VLLLTTAARAETYWSDASVEISGSGTRSSRSCTVALLPSQSLGGTNSPRLVVTTEGLSRLSFGIEGSAQYDDVMLVRNNERRPLASVASATVAEFLASDAAKALRSQRPFSVTARRRDTGKLVSSRYDRLDLDSILRRVEANCPFDAEALMTDVSDRERAERALGLSQSDIDAVRRGLSKKYVPQAGQPAAPGPLSAVERANLKRYAAENGLPASQYLTPELARRLRADGQAGKVTLTIKGRFPATGINGGSYEMQSVVAVDGNAIVYYTPIGKVYSIPSGGRTTASYPGKCNNKETAEPVKVEVSGTLAGSLVRLAYSSRLTFSRGPCAGLHNYYSETFSIDLRNGGCRFSYDVSIDRIGPNIRQHIKIDNQACTLSSG
jgi:hypothetical protein